MALNFDDFSDWSSFGGAGGEIFSWDWFEVEASGPGKVNRAAFISGLATPGLAGIWALEGPGGGASADQNGIGDGTVDIDTGYQLDIGGTDQIARLVPDQLSPNLASVYVALGSLTGQDDTVNCWLESTEVHFDSDALGAFHLKVRVKLNADGRVSISRITYQVVLLLHSTRPPEAELRPILVGGE